MILKKLNTKNPRILDLGCGTGLSALNFIKKRYKVVGIDISKEMLDKSNDYCFEKLIQQDIEEPLNVLDYSFDAVILCGSMEFVKNPLKLFKEINLKLKEKGLFALGVAKKVEYSHFPNKKPYCLKLYSYTKEEIEPLFKEANFKIIKCKEFFAYKLNDGEIVNYYGYLLEK